jgi:hypothetical protein
MLYTHTHNTNYSMIFLVNSAHELTLGHYILTRTARRKSIIGKLNPTYTNNHMEASQNKLSATYMSTEEQTPPRP